MRIVIVGLGAIGSLVGTYLIKSGQETMLVGDAPHVEAIAARGLDLRRQVGDKTTYHVEAQAVSDVAQVDFREDDVVFLCTKTYDTPAACGALKKAAGDVPVVCVQNTVANEAMAAEHFSRVYGGCVTLGASWFKPGDAVHTGNFGITVGCYPKGADDLARRIYEALDRTEIDAHLSENVMASKYSKVLVNLNNAVAAITNTCNQEQRNSYEARSFRADVLEEALRVYGAAGVELEQLPGRDQPEDMVKDFRRKDFPKVEVPEEFELRHWPSMWQDIYHKRGKVEVQWFNGEIERLGRQHGVPTPYNSLIIKVVTEMAEKREAPGKYTIAELRGMVNQAQAAS